MSGHQRANEGHTNDWLTPPDLIHALGRFDLDPCASVSQPWRTANTMLTAGGLEAIWNGCVWLNPPYGPHWQKWLERLSEHGDGIALIFARTETEAFHRLVWRRANALYFFAGRLHFHRPVSGERACFNAGAPSVLVAYGRNAVQKLTDLRMDGYFVRLK